MSNLNDVREKINKIDKQMAELFESRLMLCKEVAYYKQENALPIEDKNRERQVIDNNLLYVHDEIAKEYYVDFISDLINISKRYQNRLLEGMKISYCGAEGAFAHIAAKKTFSSQNLLPFSSFEDSYNAVVNGYCDACILPLENSFAGEVGQVLDLIFSGQLYINNVVDIDINHNLIAKKGADINKITQVASHPQALSQCHKYISEKKFKTIEMSNTAIAALQLSKSNDYSSAVIASEDVAKLYDLQILEKNINQARNNTTRFAVFSKTLNTNLSNDKMGQHFILVFTVLNEAGSLAKALNIIGSHNFNMRTLKSRPMKNLQWNYYFFVELEGNINSIDGKDMINELRSVCDRLKIAGTYNCL